MAHQIADLHWHFLYYDLSSEQGSRVPWSEGETRKLSAGPAPKCCAWGFHGCKHVADALDYAPSLMLDLRLLSGEMNSQLGKDSATVCTVICILDVTWPIFQWTAENVRASFDYAKISYDFAPLFLAVSNRSLEDYLSAAEAAKYAAERAGHAGWAAECARYTAGAARYASQAIECTRWYTAECVRYTAECTRYAAGPARYTTGPARHTEHERQRDRLLAILTPIVEERLACPNTTA